MKQLLVILSFLFVGINASGQFSSEQQRYIDSLNAVILNTNSNDTSLAKAYLELSNVLYVSNSDTMIPLCEKVISIAQNALDKNQSISSTRSLRISLSGAYSNIGVVLKRKGDVATALQYYQRGLKIQEDLSDDVGQALSLNNIAVVYYQQGEIPKALEYFAKSLRIYENAGIQKGISNGLNNIGSLYNQQGDVPKALEYFHKSLKIREETGDKPGTGITLNNIGIIYDRQGDFPKALEYLQKSLKIKEEIGNKQGTATTLNNIGLVLNHQGETGKSLEYYYKSLNIYEETGFKKGTATTLYNIGFIELKQGAIELAWENGQRGLQIARELGSPELQSFNSDLLSKVAKKQGNYKEALELYELHILMRDSIKNEKNQKATIRQQTKYEFEKALLIKEQEEKENLRVLEEETSRRDNLQYSVILISLLVIGVLLTVIGKFSIPMRVAEGLIFFAFLLFFEFLLVLADPYIEDWSGGAPGIKLLFNAGIAALIFPLHSLFERQLTRRLINQEK